ncbi:MAG: bacteriohemerythrin [Brevinematales bacterium]|nr:bacteriohemerythrin [Brevinematales bacterium]
MSYIDWNENLSVGLNSFDEQHKKLVSIVNKLYDAMKEGKGKEILGQVFSELIEYTKFHFKSEEEIMFKYDFPGYKEHLEEHNKLTKEVLELKDKYDKGNIFITVEILAFLKDWLSHHILETDKKYGSFLKSKGLN